MGVGNQLGFLVEVSLLLIYFFADNLLLLAEASDDQAHVINEVLDTFCSSFREKVNKPKLKFSFLRMFRWTQFKR